MRMLAAWKQLYLHRDTRRCSRQGPGCGSLGRGLLEGGTAAALAQLGGHVGPCLRLCSLCWGRLCGCGGTLGRAGGMLRGCLRCWEGLRS